VVLGVLGLVLFLAIALVAFRLMHSAGKRPVSDDEQQTTGDQSHTPSPADKQPALGQ
jgi:O-antigen ligase